jgi:anti-sigma-K factor RskA
VNEQEYAELAAGHALHALSPQDEAAFERARREHPEWEHHVTADIATAALLADAAPEVAPPAALRAALLAQIGATPPTGDVPAPAAPVAGDGSATPSRRRGGPASRAWFVLAASLALLVGFGWGAVVIGQQLTTPASVTALEEIRSAPDAQAATVPADGGGEATAHWSATVGKVVLVAEDLPPVGEDEDYELWFVRDGQPIAAGILTADDRTATALLDGTMEPGDIVAVTVEPAGGSPTGQPTSDPIVAIETS